MKFSSDKTQRWDSQWGRSPGIDARRARKKLRENNLRVTHKYYVIVPYSNCKADVQSPMPIFTG